MRNSLFCSGDRSLQFLLNIILKQSYLLLLDLFHLIINPNFSPFGKMCSKFMPANSSLLSPILLDSFNYIIYCLLFCNCSNIGWSSSMSIFNRLNCLGTPERYQELKTISIFTWFLTRISNHILINLKQSIHIFLIKLDNILLFNLSLVSPHYFSLYFDRLHLQRYSISHPLRFLIVFFLLLFIPLFSLYIVLKVLFKLAPSYIFHSSTLFSKLLIPSSFLPLIILNLR